MRAWFRAHQRAQALTEFAVISPVLFLMFFGIIDFGRAIYVQATLNQGVNEGARVAARGEPPDYYPASDVDVENAVKSHAQAVYLANPCPNGPIVQSQLASIPANQGWLFVTEAPAPTAQESPPPMNAPGMGAANSAIGQTAPGFGAGCNSVVPASNNTALQITAYYNFVPLTPLIGNLMAGHILLEAHAVYRTEY